MTPALRKAAPRRVGFPACLMLTIPGFRFGGSLVFRKSGLPLLLLCTSALAGCATFEKPPEISYDDAAPAVQSADPPPPVKVVELPKPLPLHNQQPANSLSSICKWEARLAMLRL